jgi:riboflavin kinase/FMN adenylyltransferase
MKILYLSENSPKQLPCVATVGIFDGVHAGHRFLINELKNIAVERKLESVVISFDKNPRSILQPDFQPLLLTTNDEKLIQFESTGINSCIVMDFTTDMSNLSAFDFIKNILSEKCNVKTLLVGHDHRFGHNRTDGFLDYQQYGAQLGIEVIQASRFITDFDKHISSSEIRLALHRGDVELANRLLTYTFSITGKVINGFKIGRKIGFPTANLALEHPQKIIPCGGVYAVHVAWNKQVFKGMLNIGVRPTLNGSKESIEVHIFDFDKDIYNQNIEILFIRRIRNEQKFNDVNELIAQLSKDKQNVIDN